MSVLEKLSPNSVFITGTSRGLGLEFVKQFCRLPNPPKHIFATCRNPDAATDLRNVADSEPSVHVIKFDVTDYQTLPSIVDQVQGYVGDAGLNLLVNNAGVYNPAKLEDVSPDMMRECYETNCIAPLMLTKAFVPFLRQASERCSGDNMGCTRAAIINISSKLSCITDNGMGYMYPQRCSKIALNMVNRSLMVDLKPDKIAAYLLNPGWVRTDMNEGKGLVTTEASVAGMMTAMAGLDEEKNGTFHDYKGEIMPM